LAVASRRAAASRGETAQSRVVGLVADTVLPHKTVEPPTITTFKHAISRATRMAKKYTAQCACGAVKFEFDTDPDFVANCHCMDCKRASGGEMATFFGVPQDDFTVVSGQAKAHHYVAESGKGLDRNFCPDCGSRLFSTNLDSFPGLVFVMLGSLDRPELIAPKLEMFTKRRLKWNKPLDMPQFESMPG
jgi:hypothetical protein